MWWYSVQASAPLGACASGMQVSSYLATSNTRQLSGGKNEKEKKKKKHQTSRQSCSNVETAAFGMSRPKPRTRWGCVASRTKLLPVVVAFSRSLLFGTSAHVTLRHLPPHLTCIWLELQKPNAKQLTATVWLDSVEQHIDDSLAEQTGSYSFIFTFVQSCFQRVKLLFGLLPRRSSYGSFNTRCPSSS